MPKVKSSKLLASLSKFLFLVADLELMILIHLVFRLMNEALERYLKHNTESIHAPEALNALVMYYYFNKRSSAADTHYGEIHAGLNLPSSNIIKIMMYTLNSTSTSEK